MPQNLEIRLLRSYAAVVNYGSMAKAAHALHLTQGAVSQQVKRLEAFLGQRLLHRHHHGLELTPDGTRLLRYAEEMIERNDRFLAETAGYKEADPVRLGIPCDLIRRYMPSILTSLSTTDPNIELSIHSGTSSELEALLISGDIDVSVLEAPGDDANENRLISERLVWVAGPGGQAYKRRPLPLSLVSERCVFRTSVFEALRKNNIPWVHRFEHGDLEAAMASVAGDVAITVCLESVVPSDFQVLASDSGLPTLPMFSITVCHAPGVCSMPINRTADSIRSAIRAV
ncbi:LysR family transcriptional regulator [Endozoicomonas sp. G2_2]|uniref:LysR family transcriptional regulator n=1 Tax=Endozoicomonas sp. G2_2 TaxID=2821092 RepID=UPI001ADCB175|nr:LysR family transcriptional regulator [Endozoicomonas sp. G2_2]MBO9471670.1 LysR family transcriptional regulator [Endozoicomonas sp. G2_2]